MPYHKYPNVEAIYLTCWKFVNWLEQLAVRVKVLVTLHVDGFHKMHYGRWLVVALGTHCLQLDERNGHVYRQSFRPLLLSLCRQYETTESVQMAMDVSAIAFGQ